MITTALPLSIALALSAGAADTPMPADVASLVAAERAFAAAAKADGVRAAFLEYLAERGVVMRPDPVAGRDYYAEQGETPAVLSWQPEFAEVARSGEFGYTTGPWEYRKDKGAEVSAYGHYVSVWKKQADGAWKVLLDAGIVHDPAPTAAVTFYAPDASTRFDDAARAPGAIFETDQAFGAALADSRGAAYEQFSDAEIRLYRMGRLPVVGVDAVREAVGEAGFQAAIEPTDAKAAASGDLGYTIGYAPGNRGSYYLRIWRRSAGGEWKIVLDLDSPMPPEE